MESALGSSENDINYRSDFDVDNDGTIDLTDLTQISQRTKDVGGGLMMYTPPGPQTLMARELGLKEDQFVEAVSQFDKNLEIRASEFLQSTTGIIYQTNDDGSLMLNEFGRPSPVIQQSGIDPLTGEPVYRQLTTLEREAFNASVSQFDDTMAQDMEQFMEELGFNKEKLEKEINSNNAGQFMQAIAMLGSAWINRGRSVPGSTDFGRGGRGVGYGAPGSFSVRVGTDGFSIG